MSHGSFRTPPRNRIGSVLFWASSLVESQRARAPQSSVDVGAPPETSPRGRNTSGEKGEEATPPVAEQTASAEKALKRPREENKAAEEEDVVSSAVQEVGAEDSLLPTAPPPSLPPLATVVKVENTAAFATPQRDWYRFKNILAVGDELFKGLLGPVCIDVELNGTTALLRDPRGFAAAIDTVERAGVDTVSGFHSSIQLFFIVRGESYYTLDSSVHSPLVFLAKLLLSPAVTKILLQAQPVYRLLFLFLGTDQVDVRNVVDVSVWSSVVERVCGPFPHTKVGDDTQSLWPLLPESARERIEVQMENAKQAREHRERGDNEECDEETTPEAGLASPTSSPTLPFAQLMERLRSLSTLHAYYDACLRTVESSGATGVVSMSLADVCHLETHVSFLCEVMTYHGMLVDKDLLDRMTEDLDQQITDLIEKGNAVLQTMSANDGENLDMETVTAETLVEVLRLYCDDFQLAEGTWEQKLRQLGEFHHREKPADENLAHLWLALHERREFKQSLLGGFSNGVKVHPRLFTVPRRTIATEGSAKSGDPQSAVATSSVKHRLFFSLHPKWSVQHATTGRVFCSRPCLQTVPKDVPLSRVMSSSSQPVTLFSNSDWTLRHLYVPPPHCSLLSFDFNQIELRVLAHLSGDELLVRHLRGSSDVLAEMACRVMQLQRQEDVTPLMRQGTKVLVYGLLYGMGPELLDVRLRQLHQETMGSAEHLPLSARQVFRSFYDSYPGVKEFLKRIRLCAFHEKQCITLNGVRNLQSETDGNRRKQVAVASVIQGGAAFILHQAMVGVHKRRHEFIPQFPAALLAPVMSVHDELVYVVPDSVVKILAPKIQHVLQHQAVELSLKVPLPVSIKSGKSLGTLEPLIL